MASLLPNIPAGAELYQRAVTNQIGATAGTSNSLGYLSTNRSQLEVVSQLTNQDAVNFFNFTFQNSGKVRATVTNIDGAAGVRVQLLDRSGSRIIADNQGTKDQKAVYADWTTKKKDGGLDLKQGQYVIKVTYGTGADKTKEQNYAIQIGSGTTFQRDYRTLASPTTIQNTLLGGGSLGYNSLSATASLLANQSVGITTDIFGTLGLFNSKIS